MILTEYFKLTQKIFTHKGKWTFITEFDNHVSQKTRSHQSENWHKQQESCTKNRRNVGTSNSEKGSRNSQEFYTYKFRKFKTLCKTFTKLSCMSQLTETALISSFKSLRRLATISHILSLATEVWNCNFQKNSRDNLFLTEHVRLSTQYQADSCAIYRCVNFCMSNILS